MPSTAHAEPGTRRGAHDLMVRGARGVLRDGPQGDPPAEWTYGKGARQTMPPGR